MVNFITPLNQYTIFFDKKVEEKSQKKLEKEFNRLTEGEGSSGVKKFIFNLPKNLVVTSHKTVKQANGFKEAEDDFRELFPDSRSNLGRNWPSCR